MKNKILLIILSISTSFVLKAQLPSYVPSSGIVGWWAFSGNASDLSGNGNNGTVLGPTLTSDRFSSSNSAYQFANNEINCGSSPIFDLNNFTISAWVNTDTLINTYQTIIAKFDVAPNGSYGLYLYDDKLLVFIQTGPAPLDYVEVYSSSSLLTNQWYHFVATHDSISGINLYIDGVLDTLLASSYNVYPAPNDSLRIGSEGPNFPVPLINGKIDDVGIWNRALNSTEVNGLFASSSIGLESENATLFSIFPNPSHDFINVYANPSIVGSYYFIHNSLGSVVLSGIITSDNITIDLSSLSVGSYIFSTESNVKQTFKIIKE